ncbi:MAG: hypothetical protein WC545_03050 [Patescibacteria group bacterium]
MINIYLPEYGSRFILENGDGTKHRFSSPNSIAKKILQDFPEAAADITHGWLENVVFTDINEDDKKNIISMVRERFQKESFKDTMENYD